MSSLSSSGFTTKYRSSPYDILECTHIRLVYWDDYPSLSIKTIDEVFSKVTENRDEFSFWDSYRENYENDTPFIFSSDKCDDPIKFNVIFYLKEDGVVSGYTQFNETQVTSDISELWIYTHFKYSSEVSDLVIKNSLESHIYENIFGNLDIKLTLDDQKYATKFLINDLYLDRYSRFTNYIHHILSDDSYSILTNKDILSKSINSRIKILTPTIPYDNVKIGVYKNDIVISSWNDYLYKVISLTKIGDNDKDFIYFSGNIRSSVASGGVGLVDYSISYVTTDYIVCHQTMNKSSEDVIVSLSDNLPRYKYSYETFIHNPYSYRSGYIVNNTSLESLTLKNRIKSNELYKKVMCSIINGDVPGSLIGVEGSFCIFKIEYNGQLYYQYSNLEGSVISKSDNLMVVNDCCILEKYNNKLYFYFTNENSTIISKSYEGRTTDPKYEYLIYEVDRSDIKNPLITGFRRNPVSYSILPDIKTAFGGLLFYLDSKNKLNYI